MRVQSLRCRVGLWVRAWLKLQDASSGFRILVLRFRIGLGAKVILHSRLQLVDWLEAVMRRWPLIVPTTEWVKKAALRAETCKQQRLETDPKGQALP